MKKNRILSLLLLSLLILHCIFPVVNAASDLPQASQTPGNADFGQGDAVNYGCHTPDARRPIYEQKDLLQYSASAMIYEVTSDTSVYAYNADKQLHPSSLVKIMTALLALEHGDITQTIVAEYEVLRSVPSAALKAGLDTGEVLTLEQLLNCMIVGSANDAAAVIAAHIGGTIENFVGMMNTRAAELGCTGTRFMNPTGLHDDDQVTTARDMVKIIREAMKHPVFCDMFGATSYRLAATNMSEERVFWTSNYMILPSSSSSNYYDNRVTGGRTGVTDNNRRCLAITAEEDGAVYIAVVLEAKPKYADNGDLEIQGSFEDMASLLNLAFDECRLVQVFCDGSIMSQTGVVNGTNDVALGTIGAVSCVLPRDCTPEQLTFRTQLKQNVLTAPVEQGIYAADCQAWYNDICIAIAQLHTMNAVPEVSRVEQQIPEEREPGVDNGWVATVLMVLGVVFSIVVIGILGIFLIRWVRVTMRKARLRQRRQDRRRSK